MTKEKTVEISPKNITKFTMSKLYENSDTYSIHLEVDLSKLIAGIKKKKPKKPANREIVKKGKFNYAEGTRTNGERQ